MEPQGIIIELIKSIKDNFEPGDVVQINPENNKIKLVDEEYSKYVIGICTEGKRKTKKINYYLNGIDTQADNNDDLKYMKVLISGICKVKTEGLVNIGDILVSSKNGRAKSARYNNDHFNTGKIIGKAIQYTEKDDEVIAIISMC